MSGLAAHEKATPTRRQGPVSRRTSAPTKLGSWQCPRCGEWWTGLAWGRACPDCGCVRLADNWRGN